MSEVKPQIILTSKHGSIKEIQLYKYQFEEKLSSDKEKFEKLSFWLTNNVSLLVYSIELTCFYSFIELKENPNQFKYSGKKTLVAPFNSSQVSNFISYLLRIQLAKKYKQFLNKNIFIVNSIELDIFYLHKCVEFNVEVFPTGDFFIHVFPTSKICSPVISNNRLYFMALKAKNQNNSKPDDMIFSIVNLEKFYRKKINLLDEDYETIIDSILSKNDSFIATYDYHFMANFNPDLFGKITEKTLKELKQIINFIDPILCEFILPDFFNLSDENYFKAELIEISSKSNLLVGENVSEMITIHSKTATQFGLRVEYTRDDVSRDNLIIDFIKNEKLISDLIEYTVPVSIKAKVEKHEDWAKAHITMFFKPNESVNFKSNVQSASYYHGIFKPVNNKSILPIVIDHKDISLFKELIEKFNKNSQNFNVLDPLFFKREDEIIAKDLETIIGKNKNKILIVVITKYKMPLGYFDPLKGFKYQIFQGEIENSNQSRAKMSNFTCKCLEKLGGIVTSISDTSLDEAGYFIGIDLGHTTYSGEKYSNLAMAMFDNRGIIIGKTIVEKLPRKENLIEEYCTIALKQLSENFKKNKGLKTPKHIVFHRDGKLHNNDINILKTSVDKVWVDISIDVVEIIKSGYPLMLLKLEKNMISNPAPGNSFQDANKKYGILVTNAQADERDITISPLIIKHKFGNIPFNKIVDQVYWLTKVYTNNLFNSTRLPATTLLANNIVGTSTKVHRASYKG